MMRSFTIICICFHLPVLLKFCSAGIAWNQSISDGETLVSPARKFELDFFSPGKSKNWYFCIWYKTTLDVVVRMGLQTKTILFADSQGVFIISRNGTPPLRYCKSCYCGQYKYKFNLSNYLRQSSIIQAIYRRLRGMLMGDDLDTGMEMFLTSWRSTDDPFPGDFIYGVENHPLPHLVISTGTRKKFRIGQWNRIQFNGLPMFPYRVEDSIVVFNNEPLISISDPYNNSLITRLTLNLSGSIQRYVLDVQKNLWNLMLQKNPCDNYGQCGPSGVCDSNYIGDH